MLVLKDSVGWLITKNGPFESKMMKAYPFSASKINNDTLPSRALPDGF